MVAQNHFLEALAGLLSLSNLASCRYVDIADAALLKAREVRETKTSPLWSKSSDPSQCCNPSPGTPWSSIDTDKLCQCGPYNPENNSFNGLYGGEVKCNTRCNNYVASQTKVVPQNDTFTSCINACSGSFEKAKRAEEAELATLQDRARTTTTGFAMPSTLYKASFLSLLA